MADQGSLYAPRKSPWKPFAEGLGLALVILAIGCCIRLEKGPIVIIEHRDVPAEKK